MKNFKIFLFSILLPIIYTSGQQPDSSTVLGNASNPCETNPCFKDIDLESQIYTGSYLIAQNDRYQSVYSSQNYGSFYEIYMRANFYDDPKNDLIKSFDFVIVNYKGPINVGFADISQKKDELFFNEKDGVIGIKILLKGKKTKNSMTYRVPKESGITKANVKQLNIFRMLVPMDGLEHSARIKDQVFDSEFYERNGLEITRKRLVPSGHYDLWKPKYFGPEIEKIADPEFFERILLFDKKKGPITIKSKDSNCYTSTMHVR